MNAETVLVSPRGMTTGLAKMVSQGCVGAGVKPVLWQQQGDRGWPTVPAPTLVIGHLKGGERRVPEELTVADRMFPGLPILLLCEESLTRGVVRLNDGRVTLLGPPFNPHVVAEAVRHAASPTSISPGHCFSRRATRVTRGLTCWAAAITQYETPRDIGEKQPAFPWVGQPDGEDSFASVLPQRPLEGVSSARYRDLVDALRGTGGLDAVAKAGNAELESAAAIAVSGAPHGAVVYLPADTVGWLCSPHRIPRVWPLPQGLTRYSLASGDLLVVSSTTAAQSIILELLRADSRGAADLFRRILLNLRQFEGAAAITLFEEW